MAMWMTNGSKGVKSHWASVAVPVRCAEGCDQCPEDYVAALKITDWALVRTFVGFFGIWQEKAFRLYR